MASPCRIPERARAREDRRARRAVALLALVSCAGGMSARAAGAPAAELPICPAQPSSVVAQRPLPNNVRVVRGAPYSALGTSETVTLLADGNRIVRQNTVRMWRDSDGRTRAEYSLSSIGGPVPLEVNATLTVIDDPAAGTRYMLQPGQGVATMSIEACRAPLEGEPGFVGPVRAPRDSSSTYAPRGAMNMSSPQALGERKVNGEVAAGSRVEAVIPAGAIGNEQPITMSAEQWYGKDLKVVVEATYRDPRTGETRYKLRDIKRSEPDAALFRVPPGRNGGKNDEDDQRGKARGSSAADDLSPAGFKR